MMVEMILKLMALVLQAPPLSELFLPLAVLSFLVLCHIHVWQGDKNEVFDSNLN